MAIPGNNTRILKIRKIGLISKLICEFSHTFRDFRRVKTDYYFGYILFAQFEPNWFSDF